MNTIDQFMELVQKHAKTQTKTRFYQHRIEHHPMNLLWENRDSVSVVGYKKALVLLTLLIVRIQTVIFSRLPNTLRRSRMNQRFIETMDRQLVPIISQFNLRPCDPVYIVQPIRSNDLNVTLRIRKYASLYVPELLASKEKKVPELFRERLLDEVIKIEKDILVEEKALHQSVKNVISIFASIVLVTISISFLDHLFQMSGIYKAHHVSDLMPLTKFATYKQAFLSFKSKGILSFLPQNMEWGIAVILVVLRTILSEKMYGIFPASIWAFVIIYGMSQSIAMDLLRWGVLCMEVEFLAALLLYFAGKAQISARRHALKCWHDVYDSTTVGDVCDSAFDKLCRSATKITIKRTRLSYVPILVFILAFLYKVVPFMAGILKAVTGG